MRLGLSTVLGGSVSLRSEAQDATCKEQDIHVITIADLNVPLAKSKQRMEEICRLMQFCNDVNGSRHCGIIELPEVAKSTSKRGLADEERELQEELWGLRQTCDARWILPFDVMPQAEHQTNRRTGTACIIALTLSSDETPGIT